MGIIIGILLFMFLVMIHELGHFIAAKRSGVKVLEFGIGIPPKVVKLWTDKSGTDYTLNLIPLGGFVRLKGEDPKHEEEFHATDSFIKAKVWKKIIILLGGVAVNFVFAWAVFSALFTVGIKPLSVIPENASAIKSESYLMPTASFLQEQGFLSGEWIPGPVTIQEVAPDSLAAKVGLQSGDVILSINEREVNAVNISMTLQRYIGQDISIDYARDNTTQNVQTQCPEDNCILGILIDSESDIQVEKIQFPFPQSIAAGWHEIESQTRLTFFTLGNLGKNLLSFNREKINGSLSNLTGPVGAIKFGEVLRTTGGRIAFLAFAAMISLALALFNILPIPALDGGRLLGVLIQRIGRLKPEKYFAIEGYINMIFFILLMGLGIYIIFKDLARFWGVELPRIG